MTNKANNEISAVKGRRVRAYARAAQRYAEYDVQGQPDIDKSTQLFTALCQCETVAFQAGAGSVDLYNAVCAHEGLVSSTVFNGMLDLSN